MVHSTYTLFRLTLAAHLISFKQIRTASQLALQTWQKMQKVNYSTKGSICMRVVDVEKRKGLQVNGGGGR